MPTSSNGPPRRTLLLTGASRGIGHATVIRFSSAGWRVITCSRHPFPEDCPWDAGPEDHIQVDLADPAGTLGAFTLSPADEHLTRAVQQHDAELKAGFGLSPAVPGASGQVGRLPLQPVDAQVGVGRRAAAEHHEPDSAVVRAAGLARHVP